jgi:cysteinyl-tRNA synthetase
MAQKLLGSDVIDIHTGGEDLIFPHHECEIAQSCGASGKDYFARYWIHAHFLFVNDEKMSKSKGTFFTARDVFNGMVPGCNRVHPSVLRFELIKSHYRRNMNFTAKGLMDSAAIVRQMIEFQEDLREKTGGAAELVELSHPVLKAFAENLADDLNISGALGVVIPWLREEHSDPAESLGVWNRINSVLGIESETDETERDTATVQQAEIWCKEMNEARRRKDYKASDAWRQKILDAGFEVQQSKDGAQIKKTLA